MLMLRKPYTEKDFQWTQWTPQDLRRLVPTIVAHKKRVYRAVKRIPPLVRTFENTIYAIEASDYPIDHLMYKAELLMNVSPRKDVRDTAQRVLNTLRKKLIDLEYDEGVYRAVKEYARKNEVLTGEDKKLFDDMLRGYRRMGFELPPKRQRRFRENVKKLSVLAQQFGKNINDYHDFIAVTPEEARGIPREVLDRFAKDARGNYVVTLQYPDLGPFMENAENTEKRRLLADKNARKGGKKNLALAQKILSLRMRNAALLGYRNHAEYKIEDKMAKTATRVFSFIRRLMPRLKPLARRELRELAALKRRHTGTREPLRYYDIAYYANQLKKERFSVDAEKVREYFPFWRVKEGIFRIYQNLFGVTFRQLREYPLWHKDVELYEVRDKQGNTLSYFLLDLYPRPGKYTHACASEVVDGRFVRFKDPREYVPPIACMIANFTKPTSHAPSLLGHDEVETFFHEFGHIMHYVLTESGYASQAGFHTAWDFVEAPSQMLEHWVWEERALKILSAHYRTKKPFPRRLLRNLIRTKRFMLGYDSLRQLVFALFDMEVHTAKKKRSLVRTYQVIANRWTEIPPSPESLFPASFGHFAGGYDAGYYGYMWSKVYAADMFTRFAREGIFNRKTGGDYRKWILAKGGSMKEENLVRAFLGRASSDRAFLKEIGIT